MKLLKTLLALACALASVSALAADADAGTLRFGLEAQYPPFESKGTNGELQVSTSTSARPFARPRI